MHKNEVFFTVQDDLDLSVVVAVYNEEQSVSPLLAKLSAVLSSLRLSYEILIVDDGSTDGTLRALKEQVGRVVGLRVIELHRNVGQVGALSAGMSVGRGRWIAMMDGDLQHEPEDLKRLVKKMLEGYDLVATYRERRVDKLNRRLITWCGNRINRYLTGVNIRDFGSAYRLFTAEILAMLKDTRGYVHYNTPEIYMNARRWTELPITQYGRAHGSSKWTLLMFILYNLDFIVSSPKVTQLLIGLSMVGVAIGSALYALYLFGSFEEVSAISAPVSIVFTSVLISILAVIWRETMRNQRFARGYPPFLIQAIWSDGQAALDRDPVRDVKQADA